MRAFYDLRYGPVSYDFVTWLVRAKAAAGERKLHVVIVPNEEGLGGFARHWGHHDEAATRWRLWNIVIPSCQLVGATFTLAYSRIQAELMQQAGDWWPSGKAHFMGPLVIEARSGKLPPKLQATEMARSIVLGWGLEKPYITITLRDQPTDPDRNTDRVEWERFADALADKGLSVIVLDEVTHCLKEPAGFFAALSVDLRLALYERAAMNFIGNNGPQELLKFSDAPYMAFAQCLSDGWRQHWREYFAMDRGDQLPWARDDQKLIFKPDTYENIVEEFEAWHG